MFCSRKPRFYLFVGLVMAITAVIPAFADETVYNDALAPGWANWSWDSTVDFTNTSPVYSGTTSISCAYTAAWGGLFLHTDSFISTAGLASLQFQIHGGTIGNHNIQVMLYDESGSAGPSMVVTSTSGIWQTVTVTISDLGNPAQISGIVWQDGSGGVQPVFYLDAIILVSVSGTPTPTPPPGIGPDLNVDAGTILYPINPDIYGMNFTDEALADELTLPVRRWGGNSTTRYSWINDTSNRAMDWFYENIPNANDHPENLPDGSASDRFVEQDIRTGTRSMITVPLIGWTPADRAFSCGFSVAKYGPQQEVDPWAPDCGNGVDTNGDDITGNDPLDTSVAIDETFVEAWIAHLISRYGSASDGGVNYYCLDNEPMLWNDTHRDIRPNPLGYDESRDRFITYGTAVKNADPDAKTLGPVTWGWTAYFYSALDWEAGGSWWLNPLDRNAHGGMAYTAWLLQEMQANETSTGIRVMDYLDLHYYPQAPGVALSSAGSAATQAMRLRTTRSLWDPTYTDESWIGEPVRFIPRLREWVDAYYPGTLLAATEYNFGALDHINGAVTQADVLGIFGREGLDMACLWDPPALTDPGAYAFRIYLNYDGLGSGFGDTSVQAVSNDQSEVSVYAAQRSADGNLTVTVINKSTENLTCTVNISGFTPTGTTTAYRYSSADLNAIEIIPGISVVDTLTMDFPAASITLFDLPGQCLNHGDVTGDGILTAGDAQTTFEIALGIITPTQDQECAADCNGDGNITAGDAQAIFGAVLGMGSCVDPVDAG